MVVVSQPSMDLQLKSGDFDGLSGVTELDLSGNGLTTLPGDLLKGLTSLRRLDLSNNRLASLPVGFFMGTHLSFLNTERNIEGDPGAPLELNPKIVRSGNGFYIDVPECNPAPLIYYLYADLVGVHDAESDQNIYTVAAWGGCSSNVFYVRDPDEDVTDPPGDTVEPSEDSPLEGFNLSFLYLDDPSQDHFERIGFGFGEVPRRKVIRVGIEDIPDVVDEHSPGDVSGDGKEFKVRLGASRAPDRALTVDYTLSFDVDTEPAADADDFVALPGAIQGIR